MYLLLLILFIRVNKKLSILEEESIDSKKDLRKKAASPKVEEVELKSESTNEDNLKERFGVIKRRRLLN